MPIFLTSITTIAAFLALYFAPINQLLGYGVCLSIGILYAFILSVTFLPAAISFKNWNPKSISISKESILEKTIRNHQPDVVIPEIEALSIESNTITLQFAIQDLSPAFNENDIFDLALESV